MRPLPGFLLLCASYGVTAIANDFSTGKNGLDYCIAEADTTSDMTASTTMAAPTCALPWSSLAAPYMPATTWAPGVCEHNPMWDVKDLNNDALSAGFFEVRAARRYFSFFQSTRGRRNRAVT